MQLARTVTVGGFLGYMTSESSYTVIMEKNQFHAGDFVNVRIIVDNRQCKKAIWGFKVKLVQTIIYPDESYVLTAYSKS